MCFVLANSRLFSLLEGVDRGICAHNDNEDEDKHDDRDMAAAHQAIVKDVDEQLVLYAGGFCSVCCSPRACT